MAIKIMTAKDYNYEPIDDGFYEAVVTELAETRKFNQFKNEEQDVLQIKFTLLDEPYKDKVVAQTFTPALTKSSNLMALCRALYGRELTVEEMATVETSEDIANLVINKPVICIIKNKPGKKDPTRMFYSITDFMKSKRGAKATPTVVKNQINKMTDEELKSIAEELDAE